MSISTLIKSDHCQTNMESKKDSSWDDHVAKAPDVPGIATNKKTLTKQVDFFDLTKDDEVAVISPPKIKLEPKPTSTIKNENESVSKLYAWLLCIIVK